MLQFKKYLKKSTSNTHFFVSVMISSKSEITFSILKLFEIRLENFKCNQSTSVYALIN